MTDFFLLGCRVWVCALIIGSKSSDSMVAGKRGGGEGGLRGLRGGVEGSRGEESREGGEGGDDGMVGSEDGEG